MRADPVRGDTRLGRQRTHDLVEPHAAEMGLARREEPGRIRRHQRGPGLHRGERAIGDRHHALAPALAAQDEEGPIRPDGAAGQRDELGRAQARAVEQLHQRGEPKVERRAGHGPVVDQREQPLDLAVRQRPGERTAGAPARQRGGRIVAAQAFLAEKGEETAQRGGLARDRAAREPGPPVGEPAERLAVGPGEPAAERDGGGAQIGRIGHQRVARGARLGGEHLEEALDQQRVLAAGQRRAGPRHQAASRCTASTAIMRASGSWPTARSAATI